LNPEVTPKMEGMGSLVADGPSQTGGTSLRERSADALET
jgi:hypothetical protein